MPPTPLPRPADDDDARRADAVLRGLARRRDLLVATGMVMATVDADAENALAALETLAQARGVGVDMVAEYLCRFPSGPAR